MFVSVSASDTDNIGLKHTSNMLVKAQQRVEQDTNISDTCTLWDGQVSNFVPFRADNYQLSSQC